tara:strand:+ start:32 stop:652 length:621 start_codon:yes stop_codon:yes gene_type:complete
LLKNKQKNRIIYLISPEKIDLNFYKNLKNVFSSSKVKYFQLRLKKIPEDKIIKIAKKIKNITKKYNIKLIINDSPEIAEIVKAEGCHIGQSDSSFASAKKKLDKKIIGVTCHGSKKLINKAINDNVDYIALGSFFKSKLKPDAKKADKNIITWLRKKSNVPIVAIGGINNKNYKRLLRLGANYIAISTYIWNNPALKPEQAIKRFK